MTNKILRPQNEERGFYGTINNHYSKEKTDKKWAEAFKLLLDLSGKKSEKIRDYLDSRSGRKLADCVIDLKGNLKDVIVKEYSKWVEFDLFGCSQKDYSVTNKILFGTRVHDDINNKYVLILSQGKIKGLTGDSFKVMDCNENKYIIKMDFLTPIEK